MSSPQSRRTTNQHRRWLYAMMVVVLLFGVLLAMGAVRAFGSRGGWRQAAIIVACSLAFLGLWWLVVRSTGRRALAMHNTQETMDGGRRARRGDSDVARLGWSRSGWASTLVAGCVTIALLVIRLGAVALTPAQVGQAVLGATAGTGMAMVLAIIAASDPRPRPGRALGLLALLLAAANVALMIALIVIPL